MIDQELARKFKEVLLPHQLKMIGVFGSYFRAENSPSSDLDMLVQFNKGMGLIKLVKLQHKLSDKLGLDVDLVTENSIKNSRLRQYILKDLITIYHEKEQPHLS